MDHPEQFSDHYPSETEGQDLTDAIEPTISMDQGAGDAPRQSAPRARRPRKSAKARPAAEEAAEVATEPGAVVGQATEPVTTIAGLEARGFSATEVASLLDVTQRVANSSEVREEQAIMRRLRFQRWLIEHGRLNEYDAHDLLPLGASDEALGNEQSA